MTNWRDIYIFLPSFDKLSIYVVSNFIIRLYISFSLYNANRQYEKQLINIRNDA